MHIDDLLRAMVAKGASDLHLRVASAPVFRVHGGLVRDPDAPPLTADDLKGILDSIGSPEQRDNFYKNLELDMAYGIAGVGRFRVNVMRQRGTLAFVFRMVPFDIPSIDKLGLPPLCKDLILKPRGLILVTGPTGSGKSTTMAAMIDYLNETMARNVITIEDPIEFLHRNKKCIIAQRDLGDDTKSFDVALTHALRQDPNVIIVGEMRDLATISIAIRAAETGHLVMGTLHTTDAPQTVDRVIDIFPPEQQQQIRLQMSQTLEAVLSQVLVPKADGSGRAGAFEVLVATPAVRNLIRSGKTFELHSIMQMSAKDGMQTLDQVLADLIKKKVITQEAAMLKTSNPDRLAKLLQFPGVKV
ncbi:MAG: type IV pilus twitching motility protein PilT [Chloroflexi bacterium]|nr:type IV pilus twitching motility protein PilT [Chloroflexota bacterium]